MDPCNMNSNYFCSTFKFNNCPLKFPVKANGKQEWTGSTPPPRQFYKVSFIQSLM